MLGRLHPKTRFAKFRDFLWPRMGWKRYFRMIMLQFAHLRGNSDKLARGIAYGAAWSATPLLGAHSILAVLCAYYGGGSIVAALFGVLIVGNFIVIPIFWYIDYQIGFFLLNSIGLIDSATTSSLDVDKASDFSYIWNNLFGLYIPTLLGSVFLGLIVYYLCYFLLKWRLKKLQSYMRQYQSTQRALKSSYLRGHSKKL